MHRVVAITASIHFVQRIQQIRAILHGEGVLRTRFAGMHFKEERKRFFQIGEIKLDHDQSSMSM